MLTNSVMIIKYIKVVINYAPPGTLSSILINSFWTERLDCSLIPHLSTIALNVSAEFSH